MKPDGLVLCVPLAAQFVASLELDLNDPNSIKDAAKSAAEGMMKWYSGDTMAGGIPGLLPGPYYWWEAGAMFGAIIDYWYYTGDDTYNDRTMKAMQFQIGPDDNYMPPNQSKSLGNDDQAFWGIAALTAAEVNFPNPPAGQPHWLALAQGVFNSQAPRWDTASCDGGLKWQISPLNNGYNYKNAISNGCFFNMAARLGLYTGNTSYFDWAEKTWDWVAGPVGLINNQSYVFDGSDDAMDCAEVSHLQWSYNAGVFLYGAAVMWNATEGDTQVKWETRTRGLLTGIVPVFFNNQTMIEIACERGGNCNIDQQTFKAYLARWMAASVKVAPWTHDTIMPLIRTSALAAARSCTGGDDGRTCGTDWISGEWDGAFGVGQQMSALEVIQSTMIDTVQGPLGNGTGATSVGDPSAGAGGRWDLTPLNAITTADQVGAGILTAVVLSGLTGCFYWMLV